MNQDPAVDDVRITRAIVGALRGRDLSGWQIWIWLGPTHGNKTALTEANLYPTLYALEAKGLIQGRWHEDERTRRLYRITATGLRKANSEGWGAVAFRRNRSWSSDGPVAAGDFGPIHADDDGEWVWPGDDIMHPSDPDNPPGAPEEALVGTYLDRLAQHLRLAPIYESDVINEIGDHIADTTARLSGHGSTCADAAEASIEALGSPDTLAAAINAAQLSEGRLNRGMGWGGAFALLTGLFGFALSWGVLLIGVPVCAGFLFSLALEAGVHVYAPITGEWAAEAFIAAVAAGAFVGARQSLPYVAHHSHRAAFDVRSTWAFAGSIPLILVALLMPVNLDPLNVALLAGIPTAWWFGCRRPAVLYGETVFVRGLVTGLAVLVLLMFLPGGRVWEFDSTQIPAADPTEELNASVTVMWDGTTDAMQKAFIAGLPSGWHDEQLELWPADRIGPIVTPDTKAQTPTLVLPGGGLVNFDSLPSGQADWWVVVTATSPDGHRRVVHTEVHFGHPKP